MSVAAPITDERFNERFNRFNVIPASLRCRNNFVCWRYEVQNGRRTKVPYDARTGVRAKSNDTTTWSTFEQAVEAANNPANKYDGIGFQVSAPIVGFDFDGVVDNGKIDPYVVEVLRLLGNPYAEITPSGKGVRAFVMGVLPEDWQKRRLDESRNGEKCGAEIYDKSHYLTLTGNQLPGSGGSNGGSGGDVPHVDVRVPYKICLDPEFRALWMGDTSKHAGDQSRADLALCARLAQIFGDGEAVKEWFGKSVLGQREKWQKREDYRQMTIGKVLEGASTPQIESALDVVMADAVDPKKIQWLWPKRVPLGHLTIFCGSPDNGKSLVTLFLVAAMTTGREFPDAPNSNTPSEVLVLSGEDGIEDTVVPRLMAAGADLSKVHILKSVTFGNKSNKKETRYVQLDTDVKMLRDYLVAHAAIKLVVIDPVSNYLGSVKMTDEQNVRRVLNPVKDVAESTACALVGVMHLNKKEELSAIHRIAGAMAFVGIARATWMFAANPSELLPDTFSMLRVKVNIAERSGGLTYRIKAKPVSVENSEEWYPFIEWTGTTEKNADNVLKPKEPSKPNHRPPSDREEAMVWLTGFLKDGPRPAVEVLEEGKGLHGFSQRTLERAKKEIKAESFKQFGKYFWSLGDTLDRHKSDSQ